MALVECELGTTLFTEGDVLGLTSPVGDSEKLVVSLRAGQIQVYNMTSPCCVHSWQASSSQTLTCPAVFHNQTYWSVANGTNVLKWRSNETSFSQLEEDLPSPAHCILVSHGNKHPVVVLCDGSVHVIGSSFTRNMRRKHSKILLANVFQTTGGDCICVVDATSECRVSVWAVSAEGVELVVRVTPDINDLISFCLCKDSLISLASDGQLYSSSLSEIMETKLSQLVPRCLVVPSQPHPSQPVSLQLASVSTNYFVVYDNDCLSLWEQLYMTCQATVHIGPSMKVLSSAGYVCLFGPAGRKRVWQVEGGGCALVNALGKNGPAPRLLITSGHWGPQTVIESEKGQEVIAILQDKAKTPTLDSFMLTFENCTLDSDLCYIPVIERILCETDFWGREPLIKLIRFGVVPSSLCDQLLTVCAVHSDWWLLMGCLEHCSGFSETVLVATVQTVLPLPLETNVFNNIVMRDSLLSLLLCQPFNDALLQLPLSRMSHSEVKNLLKFITDHVGVVQMLATPISSSYDSLLDWAGQLIDVHFTHLTLDAGTREVLVKLQSLVRDQVTLLNRLSLVRGVGVASHALTRKPVTNGWLYRVETVDINI